MEVVQYSANGLRARSSTPAPPRLHAGEVVEIQLQNPHLGSHVHARGMLMRIEKTPHGVDLCFAYQGMDHRSSETYQQWLAAEA